MSITRRQSRQVIVGGQVRIGGGAPVAVQAMTDTNTANTAATAAQCAALARAGAELVRITVNTPKAAQATPEVRARLDDMGIAVPLVGDFHFNGHKLLSQYPACARALAKYRINPGNVGAGRQKRHSVCGDDSRRHGTWQAGAHRRKLGQFRARASGAINGR